jgi:AcrR family transcriptional regulator
MARPSHNIDQRLLDAGMELLPQTGCRGLSARKLTEHAGVNLGMFHYHFRSKDNFIRTLLQQTYEKMFQDLVLQSHEGVSPVDNLRKAIRVIAGFGLTHRQLLLRIGADALAGEKLAAEFLHANLPRHIGVLARLIAEGQRAGLLAKAPMPQVIAFIAGAVMSPVLLGTALLENGGLPTAAGAVLEHEVLSKKAIEQRIEFALRGLSAPEGETP